MRVHDVGRVMDIGPVLVFVHEGRVLVFVTVRTSRLGAGRMFVVMVQVVVGVQVAMCPGLVRVAMFVVLGDVEPHSESPISAPAGDNKVGIVSPRTPIATTTPGREPAKNRGSRASPSARNARRTA